MYSAGCCRTGWVDGASGVEASPSVTVRYRTARSRYGDLWGSTTVDVCCVHQSLPGLGPGELEEVGSAVEVGQPGLTSASEVGQTGLTLMVGQIHLPQWIGLLGDEEEFGSAVDQVNLTVECDQIHHRRG